MKEKLTIAKKLSKRKYRPAPRPIAWIYKTVMADIIGRKYKPIIKKWKAFKTHSATLNQMILNLKSSLLILKTLHQIQMKFFISQ